MLHQDFGLVLVKLPEASDTSFLQVLENFIFLSACPPAYLPSPGLISLSGLLWVKFLSSRSLTETLSRMGLILVPWGDTVSNQAALSVLTVTQTLESWSHASFPRIWPSAYSISSSPAWALGHYRRSRQKLCKVWCSHLIIGARRFRSRDLWAAKDSFWFIDFCLFLLISFLVFTLLLIHS